MYSLIAQVSGDERQYSLHLGGEVSGRRLTPQSYGRCVGSKGGLGNTKNFFKVEVKTGNTNKIQIGWRNQH